MNSAKDDKDEETKDRNADQSFMDELTRDCEEKAGLWDQRSKTRSDELKALADATEELQKGATPNFSANKKLVGFQRKAVVKKAAIAPVSFVQLNSAKNDNSQSKIIVKKVLDLLKVAAK